MLYVAVKSSFLHYTLSCKRFTSVRASIARQEVVDKEFQTDNLMTINAKKQT